MENITEKEELQQLLAIPKKNRTQTQKFRLKQLEKVIDLKSYQVKFEVTGFGIMIYGKDVSVAT